MQIIPEWLGLVPYAEALEIQDNRGRQVARSRQIFLLGLEHPLVATLGVRGDPEADIVGDIPFTQTRRGGQATLHNEGQLVIYPVMNLKQLNLRPKCYVQILIEAAKESLCELGIKAEEGDAPGLFVQGRKIASFGVQIERGVTRHGLSINVSNDLTAFAGIRVCGVENQLVTSVQDLGFSMNTRELFESWAGHFVNGLQGQILTPDLIPTTLDLS